MPVNRYDVPAEFSYMQAPFEEIMHTGALMQGQEDKAKKAIAEIGNKQYYSTTKDQEGLMKAKADILAKRDAIYEKNKERGFRGASQDIHNLQRELEKREGQGGDLYAYQKSLEAQQKYNKEIDENKDIDVEKKKWLKSKSEEEYAGIGEPNDYGLYNSFTGIPAAKNVDLAKQVNEHLQGWKANAKKSGQWKLNKDGSLATTQDGNYFKKTTSGWEEVKESEIVNAIRPILMENPENQAYAAQEVDMQTRGMDMNQPIEGRDANGYPINVNPISYKNKLYNDVFESAINYAAAKGGYKETVYDEDLKDNQLALERGKKKIEELPEVLGKEVTAPTYGTKIDSNIALQEGKVAGVEGMKLELAKILEKTPNLKTKYKYATTTGFIDGIMAMPPDKRNAQIEQLLKDTPRDRQGLIKGMLQNQQDIEQRDVEATEYVEKNVRNKEAFKREEQIRTAIGTLDIGNPNAVKDELKRLGVKVKTKTGSVAEDDANMLALLNAKGLTDATSFKGVNDENYKLIKEAQELRYGTGTKTESQNLREEYLKQTAEKHVPLSMADSYIIPTTLSKDADGRTVVAGDMKKGEDITVAIGKMYKAGGLDNLTTNVINEETGLPYKVSELMALHATKNDDGEITKFPDRTPFFFTRLQGEGGVRQFVTTIGDQEVKINSDQIEVPYNGQMTRVSEITDSPLQQINSRIIRAYNNGLTKIEAANGITIQVPYDIEEEGVRNGTFANNNELVVTVAPEDQKKYKLPDNLMGGDAIQYLLNKQSQGVINF